MVDGFGVGYGAVGAVRAQEVLFKLAAFCDVLVDDVYLVGSVCGFSRRAFRRFVHGQRRQGHTRQQQAKGQQQRKRPSLPP